MNFVFEEVTDRDVIRFCHLQNGQNWHGLLSIEEYADREAYLATAPIAKIPERFGTGDVLGLHYWVMRDLSLEKQESDDERTFNIVSACETMHREWYRSDYDVSEGKAITKVVAVPTLGGVFTPEKYRGRGYATTMLWELNKKLVEMSQDEGYGQCVLYSEVGEYYSKFGYTSHYVPKWEIDVSQMTVETHSGAKWLGMGELKPLYDKYSAVLLRHLEKASTEQPQMAMVPTEGSAYWFHLRSKFYSRLWRGREPEYFAVSLDGGFSVFTLDFVENAVYLLTLYAKDSDTAHELIKLLIAETKRVGFSKLEGWVSDLQDYNFTHDTRFTKEMEAFYGANMNVENGSLSAVWFYDESKLKPKWVMNGKLSWF